jgi:hypothetical protein
MIEKGSNYAFLVKAQQAFTFRKVKAFADQFICALTNEQRTILFDELQQNDGLPDTEPLLAADLSANGDICESRLQYAFTHLPTAFFDKEIELIDYDCGQATGVMIYHDFLQNKSLNQIIRRITLINASEISLKRAALHAQQFFPQAELRTLCKPARELKAGELRTNAPWAKLHLLANLLNLDVASAMQLSEIIQAGLSGYNQFICIGPYDGESSAARMDAFVDAMNVDMQMTVSEDMKSNRMIPGQTWTCSLRVFTKEGGEPELFEIEDSTTDRIDEANMNSCDGVLYSHDMSRLIHYPSDREELHFIVPQPVQSIDPYAFAGSRRLQSILLPDTLISIGEGACEGCEQLRSLVIPESVTRIGGYAFAACTALATLVFNAHQCGPTNSKSLVFEGCHALATIHIGSKVQVIPDFLFSRCESLYSILLPESVTYLGKEAFSFCTHLESITLPASILVIGSPVFEGCKHLRTIFVPRGMSSYFGTFEALQAHEALLADDDSEEDEGFGEGEEDEEEEDRHFEEAATALPAIVKSLQEAALRGNPKAQNNLGFLYETGTNVKKDDAEAVKWYRKAAEQGHAKAQYNLANHYAQGCGVTRNDQEALKWYQEAAKNGLTNAMTHLGALYATGRGIERDEAQAIEWFLKAAQQGDETAIRTLRKRGISFD